MTESVKTLRASGGDYTSIQTWWNTECKEFDCVANATSPVLECYNDWPTGLAESFVNLAGGAVFARNSTYRPILRAAAGNGHNMTKGAGFFVTGSVAYGYILSPESCDTDEIEVRNTKSGTAANSTALGGSAKHRRLISVARTGSGSCAFYNLQSNLDARYLLAYGAAIGYNTNTYQTITLDCCGAANCVSGFSVGSNSTITARNNWALGCTTGFGGGGAWSGASTNNASDDATVTSLGIGTITALSNADFADAANDDYHLSPTSQLIGAGANLYTDGSDVDIDGEAWPNAAWDIGFDYYVAAGSTTPITTDLNLQWNILQQLTTDNDMRWQILNTVDTDLQTAWHLLNQVTKDEFTSWDVLQQLSRDVNLSWDVIAALFHITGDMNLRWSIINAVQKDQQTAWDLLNSVNRSTAMSWNLLNAMTRDMQAGWHILESVEQDVDLRWNVASTLTPITTDLGLRWNLLQAISRSFDTQWDLLEAVTQDQDIRWGVANAVVTELNTRWDIRHQVVTDFNLRWNSLEVRQNSLTLQWSVDGQTITPISFIPVQAERRNIALASENRMISIPAENRTLTVRRA